MKNSEFWMCPAVVKAVDIENRFVHVLMLGTNRSANNVLVVNDYGSNSFPAIGDGVLIAVVDHREYCLGKLPQAFGNQISNNYKDVNKNKILSKKVDEGGTSIANGRTTTSLFLPNTGNFYLTNGCKDGLAYTKKYRLTELLGNSINLSCLADNVVQRMGSVIRTIANVTQVIPKLASTAIEYTVELFNNTIKFVRFKLGHVIDSNGLPEYSSSGGELRTLVEVNDTLGVNKATVTIDEDGNVEIKSSLGIIALDAKAVAGILLSGLTSQYSAVLGEKLMTMYKAHTHPSPMGTTGTPTPNPTLDDNSVVLSNQVKLN